ncbi:hypothetical protein T12_17110 [Trichinella patagoniensis]|uniref:Uncharacterized protein n=1 Tax=Trichinella patagoniensis TaxID=990121 RepID=A0A0V1A3H1_9BILA|nr:hypothetical protein T12_17110 [Trichinella patagoniensis]
MGQLYLKDKDNSGFYCCANDPGSAKGSVGQKLSADEANGHRLRQPVVNRLTNENDPLDCNNCLNVVQLCLANYRPSALRIYATIASSACENAKLTHPLGAPYEKSVLLIETNFLVNAMIMLKLNPIIFEWLQLNDYAHQEASLITQK